MAGLLSPYVTSWDDDTAAFLHDTDVHNSQYAEPYPDLPSVHDAFTGDLDPAMVRINLLSLPDADRTIYLDWLGIEPATIGDFL